MIKIESFGPEDFSRLISWIDSEETLVQFAGSMFSFPLTNQQLENYLTDQNRNAYKIISAEHNAVIGHGEVYARDDDTAILCRILIGPVTYRGKGFGQRIVRELLNVTFNELGRISAELNVYDWNIPAIKCYEKTGFTINEGQKRSTTVNGKVWTALNMRINKMDWEELMQKEAKFK